MLTIIHGSSVSWPMIVALLIGSVICLLLIFRYSGRVRLRYVFVNENINHSRMMLFEMVNNILSEKRGKSREKSECVLI